MYLHEVAKELNKLLE